MLVLVRWWSTSSVVSRTSVDNGATITGKTSRLYLSVFKLDFRETSSGWDQFTHPAHKASPFFCLWGLRSSTIVFWGASWSETTGPSPASCPCTRSWSCRMPSSYWTHLWETWAQRHLLFLCSTSHRLMCFDVFSSIKSILSEISRFYVNWKVHYNSLSVLSQSVSPSKILRRYLLTVSITASAPIHEAKSNLAPADDAVSRPLLTATHLNVDSNNQTSHFSSISRSPFTALASYQRRAEGGVSAEEEVPGCRREENARHPVEEHVQDQTEGERCTCRETCRQEACGRLEGLLSCGLSCLSWTTELYKL